MVTAKTEEWIKILCREHRVSWLAPRASVVTCEQGKHELSQDFPYGEYWAYCCDCQHFWQSDLKGEKASPNCLACDREIRAWYLCAECKVLTFECELGRYVADKKPYSFGALDHPQPACPGCLRPVAGPLMIHGCDSISVAGAADGADVSVVYTTTLRCCPFCGEATRPAPPVEVPRESTTGASAAAAPEPEPIPAAAAAAARDAEPEVPETAMPAQRKTLWPNSGKQWAELIALVSAVVGILAFVFPSSRADIMWLARRPFNDKPTVKLNCDKQEILVDEQVVLKAVADDDYDRATLKYRWLPPEQVKLEKVGPDESQMMIKLLGLKPQSMAVPVEVGVEVTDSHGRSASDKMTFYVTTPEILNANKAPQITGITVSPRSEVQVGEIVTLRADVIDPNQRPEQLNYHWQASEGPMSWVGATATLNTAAVAPMSDRPVELRVTVTVNDLLGGITSSPITIRVFRKLPLKDAAGLVPSIAVNNSPRLNSFGPEQNPVRTGEEVRVRASAFDQDGDTLVYGWKVPELQIGSESGSPVFSFKVPDGAAGKQVLVILEVRDNRGGRVEQQTSVTITPPPPATPSPQPTAAPAAHPSPTAEKKAPPATPDGPVKN